MNGLVRWPMDMWGKISIPSFCSQFMIMIHHQIILRLSKDSHILSPLMHQDVTVTAAVTWEIKMHMKGQLLWPLIGFEMSEVTVLTIQRLPALIFSCWAQTSTRSKPPPEGSLGGLSLPLRPTNAIPRTCLFVDFFKNLHFLDWKNTERKTQKRGTPFNDDLITT